MNRNEKTFSMYHFPTLLTPLPFIRFTAEEITDCTNEVAKGAGKALRNLSSCFFISCFTVSVTSSNNTPEFPTDFMILIKSSISLFQINKENAFPALTAPFTLIFLPNLFIAFEVKLLTNPCKYSLAKGIAMFTKLPNQEAKDPPD